MSLFRCHIFVKLLRHYFWFGWNKPRLQPWSWWDVCNTAVIIQMSLVNSATKAQAPYPVTAVNSSRPELLDRSFGWLEGGYNGGLYSVLTFCCSHCHCSRQSVMAIGQSWLADDDAYDTSTPYYHSSVYGWYNGFVWWVRFLSTLIYYIGMFSGKNMTVCNQCIPNNLTVDCALTLFWDVAQWFNPFY